MASSQAAGDAEMLYVLGRKHNLDVAIVELVNCDISDKRVRGPCARSLR